MSRPETHLLDVFFLIEPIRLRCGDKLAKDVEKFVFKNLIYLNLKIDPKSRDEFFKMYLPDTTESSWKMIGN